MKKYPDYIMEYVRQSLGLKANDTSKDDYIEFEMTTDDVFDAVLEWKGIIGYGCTIRSWVEDIYEVKLKDRVE